MEDWVFVDTCVWVSFFTKPGSPEKHAVDVLLDHDRVAAAKGHTLPLTDLSLAAVARRLNAFVYTVDPHFDPIPDLKRWTP